MSSRVGKQYYRPLAQAAIRRARLIVDSAAVADEVSALFNVPRTEIEVVYPGTGLVRLDVVPHRRTRPYLLAVGTREPRKNFPALVTAFSSSAAAREHDLLIVGRQGWSRAEVSSRSVTVLSNLSDGELASLYRGATAVVVPSIYEGFGLPIVEALAQGTRVACSNIPVFREVAGPYATFFDHADLDSIRDAIEQVVDDPVALDAEAVSWAANFTWDRAADKLLRLYADA